jgi:hypothetical protein
VTDSDVPDWYNKCRGIEISNYQSWEEVTQDLAPFYSYREDWVTDEMRTLVGTWKKESYDLFSAVTRAVRFVQQDIHHQSFAGEATRHIPNTPAQVLHQRFGDSKGKTLLLKTFLHLLGVHSSGVLVSSMSKERILDRLPRARAFDHLILRFDFDGETYWIDATHTDYKGPLAPDEGAFYGVGLVLESPWQELVTMKKNPAAHRIRVKSHYKFVSPEEIQVSLTETYFNLAASSLRKMIDQEGEEAVKEAQIEKLKLRYLSINRYPSCEIKNEPEGNQIKVNFVFSIKPYGKFCIVNLYSMIQNGFLNASSQKSRILPYKLHDDSSIEEEILIESPNENWKSKTKKIRKDTPACFYEGLYEATARQLRIYQKLIYPKDYVMGEEWPAYIDLLQESLSLYDAFVAFK